MNDRYPHKRLAAQLAKKAREIASERGDVCAQVSVYGELIDLWEHTAPSPQPSSRNEFGTGSPGDRAQAARSHYLAQGMDPSVYLYEEFLRAYDPATSKKRGVHYSPPEVVAFMVRAVESVLQTEFGQALADAVVVDPCCGIGTFLRHIEKLPGPHPKTIGIELSEPTCALAARLLPNSPIIHGDWLDDLDIENGELPLVVVGNPPYSGHSANPGRIGALMADYRRDLTERNPKWLQDDYVKFIRMAQHRVVGAGSGIVAFITNHSYLFNPTFRAMRHSLMQDFDLIYVVDLQGNAKRNDIISGPDENVFPIQMGVGISVMVRLPNRRPCSVQHTQTRGTRQEKLNWLAEAELGKLPWREAPCLEPFHMFVPEEPDRRREYMGFPSVLDFFGEKSVGFVTSRDAFAVDVDRDALLSRIEALRESDLTPDEIRVAYPVGDLDVEHARRVLRADSRWQDRAISVLYRPFDPRWVYYSPAIMERPRLPFMRHMMAENVAILVGRAGQATGSQVWNVVFCADKPVDLNLFRRGGATILPRYVCSENTRRSNMINTPFDPDMLFGYIYAVLHSSEYRTRYADFLRFDFPRVPIHTDTNIVEALANAGRELMQLHLMRRDPSPSVEGEGLTIGGYDLPGKFAADRKKTGLSESDRQRIEWISHAAGETMALQSRIDEVLKSSPPWPR